MIKLRKLLIGFKVKADISYKIYAWINNKKYLSLAYIGSCSALMGKKTQKS